MHRFILVFGVVLGMRRNLGYRQFNEMPSFFHYFMALNLGTMGYLLSLISKDLFPAYIELLETEELSSFLTFPGIFVSLIVVSLGALMFWVALKFSRHWKVLVGRGMEKRGRQHRR